MRHRIDFESTVERQAADLLHACIKKQKFASKDLLLALNALDTPAYTFLDVVGEFRERFGKAVAAMGFQAVWLVGPTADLTERLDTW